MTSSQKSFLDEIDLSKPVLPPLPSRSTDPETSKIAAEAHKEQGASNEDRVVRAVNENPGLTYHDYGVITGLDHVEAMRRLNTAERHGRVRSDPSIKKQPASTKYRATCKTWWPVT